MPWELAGWRGRFDDPARSFRTVYVAEQPETALRETLAPLRPDAAALAALRQLHGTRSAVERELGAVSLAEQARRVLAAGRLDAFHPLVDLTDHAVRLAAGREHARILAAFDVPHLDETDLCSRDRGFTQALARAFYDAGSGGAIYPSNVDGSRCVALFEGRGELSRSGEPPRRLADHRDLLEVVCVELGLALVE